MDDEPARALAIELLRYLSEHPGAADTSDGIAQWWLPKAAAFGRGEVEAALALLVRDGALARHALPDGRVLFAATGAGSPLASASRWKF